MRPLETMTGLLTQPGFQGKQSLHQEALAKLKDVLMATYFAADHVVWAYQIGLVTDKKRGERAQKVSLWSWALGSVLTMVIEADAILSVRASSRVGKPQFSNAAEIR
eukprot:GHRQ01036409.1.p2 GENE.GHRQ01036409.1~~GHRQ01036409.1.p2  ORF type:complete len:107 (-),score=30.94 GHRQ01036409.1:159-479(-)